jgi:hypothetical protein
MRVCVRAQVSDSRLLLAAQHSAQMGIASQQPVMSFSSGKPATAGKVSRHYPFLLSDAGAGFACYEHGDGRKPSAGGGGKKG